MMGIWGILHDTAALVVIICALIVPFTAMKIKNSGKEEAVKRAGTASTLLRIPQYVLIVSLITGFARYGFHFTTWLLTVLVIFLAILAFAGIATKAAKTVKQQAQNGESYTAAAQKLFTFSLLSCLAVIIMVVFKVAG
ncbi:UNVERIFIED_CONTAM: putative membrane protein [Brevibacillus sp. OAP136]